MRYGDLHLIAYPGNRPDTPDAVLPYINERHSRISEWSQLIEKIQTNDDRLRRTYIEIHSSVKRVDIIRVQPLAEARIRVKANITLKPQGNMNQEDTFALVDGNGGSLLAK